MPTLTDAQLFAEVDDLIRAMPDRATIRHDVAENHQWFGRAAMLVERWAPHKAVGLSILLDRITGRDAAVAHSALKTFQMLLHQAHSDLRLNSGAPTSIAVEHGRTFAYFDELRKQIELASVDLLFVDPYLDAEFVSRYLPHVREDVSIRLLTQSKMLPQLLPAVDAFVQEHGRKIAVRRASNLHDRYVIVDGAHCFQSGASFKDGAKRAMTTLTQIVDAFDAVCAAYEEKWAEAEAT